MTDDNANFWAKVRSGAPGDCWEWAASRQSKGYGQFFPSTRGGGKKVGLLAHRVSFELARGPIPAGLCVCHTCDNPPCCNPAHLFLGTNAENTADMVAKGRANGGGRKLTDADVAAIRASLTGRWGERGEIARAYGVSNATISRICLPAERPAWWRSTTTPHQ